MTDIPGPVRVRFAPSPTGFLHVGGARTAIYNQLLRQKLGGAFILRIEDTDRERSDDAMTQQIQDALSWLGVASDEGPVLQSARIDHHKERAQELLASGAAYRAYETPEELSALREEAESQGDRFRYRRALSPLDEAEKEHREQSGAPYTVRFEMPMGNIAFRDIVRGPVDYPPDALDDLILLRSDGSPTYHLSVVCDDIDMEVTHVIRGEDHLPNTPKHIALFEAFGAPVPQFAHLPLILGANRKRLSKRTGATSVEEFRNQGILSAALYNFLALLGWNPGDDREVMGRQEMVEAFTTDRLNDSAAVFDVEKLYWMNAQYLSSSTLEEIVTAVQPFLSEFGLPEPDAQLTAAIDLHRTRAKTLRELAEAVRIYSAAELDYSVEAAKKFRRDPELPDRLEALAERFGALEPFDVESTEGALRGLCTELDLKAGVLIHPTRMALSGQKAGPPLFDLVVAHGRTRAVDLLRAFAADLRAHPLEE